MRFIARRRGGRVTTANLAVEPMNERTQAVAPALALDGESRDWLRDLRSCGATKDEAVARLHELLLRAARFEVSRRRGALPHVRGDELDDIGLEAADDALMSVLRRLDDFRGASRFTTWAYKFALLEAAVKLRKRAWQGREVPSSPGAGTRSGARISAPTPRPSSGSSWPRCSAGSRRR